MYMGYIYPSLLTTAIVGGHVVAVVGTWTLLLLLRIVGVRGTHPARTNMSARRATHAGSWYTDSGE